MTGWFTPDPRDLDAPAAVSAGRDPLLARAARYARWDGTQTIPAFDADEILDALADDVMAEGDLAEALRRLMERGWRTSDPTRRDMPGLNELRERLRRRREELQERYQLRDVLADVRQELDDIVAEERAGIERRLDDAARPPTPGSDEEPASNAALRNMLRDAAARRIDQLDALPRDVGGRIRRLEEYDFMEPAARDRFNELTERLRKQTLDRFVEGLSEAIQGTTPEELQANRDMVRDLNELLEQRLDGREPPQDDVDEFLGKHGRFFPGARTLDDIVEQLTQRMAAMASLLRSMTPEQRAELQSMMDALLRDDRLRWDLARLASNMDQLMPDGLGEGYEFSGEQPLGFEPALDRIGQLQALDAMEDQLDGIESPADLAGLDRDEVNELLGPEPARDLAALDDLARRLEEAGYLSRRGDRLELTPRGSRRIGQKVLDDLFSRLSRDAFGGHRIDRAGRGGERDETTKPYEFGDPFHLDSGARSTNAFVGPRTRRPSAWPRRAAGAPLIGGLRGVPNGTADADVDGPARGHEPVDAAARLLRRGQEGRRRARHADPDPVPARRPVRDRLRLLRPGAPAGGARRADLARLRVRHEPPARADAGPADPGPAAGRRTRRSSSSPMASRPPISRTARSSSATRRRGGRSRRPSARSQRCTKEGITINTFMLERSRALAEFVALVTRLNRGRAFYADPGAPRRVRPGRLRQRAGRRRRIASARSPQRPRSALS